MATPVILKKRPNDGRLWIETRLPLCERQTTVTLDLPAQWDRTEEGAKYYFGWTGHVWEKEDPSLFALIRELSVIDGLSRVSISVRTISLDKWNGTFSWTELFPAIKRVVADVLDPVPLEFQEFPDVGFQGEEEFLIAVGELNGGLQEIKVVDGPGLFGRRKSKAHCRTCQCQAGDLPSAAIPT